MSRHSLSSVVGLSCTILLTGSLSRAALANVPSLADNPPHLTVKYGDLNLNSREGIDVLYQRIKGAARQVCDEAVNRSDPFRLGLWSSCYHTAIAQAVGKVNNVKLTQRHAEATGGRLG